MKTKKLLFGIFLVGICSLMFASCAKDDQDQETTVQYDMGFDKVNSSDLSEVGAIEKIYQSGLNVESDSFSKQGKISDCDREVKEACQETEQEHINSKKWKGSYTFVVRNMNTTEVIYSKQIN